MADIIRFPNRAMYQDMKTWKRAASVKASPRRFMVIDTIGQLQDAMPDYGLDIFESIMKKDDFRNQAAENIPAWRKHLQNLLRAGDALSCLSI